MGNRYIEKECPKCKAITFHRVFRRFGKLSTDGRKRMRREVTWCLKCQRRVIDNKGEGRQRKVVALRMG